MAPVISLFSLIKKTANMTGNRYGIFSPLRFKVVLMVQCNVEQPAI